MRGMYQFVPLKRLPLNELLVLSRFDGPGCGSASDRVSELNTSGRTGEGRVLMLAVHHQSHFHLLIEASKIDLLQMQRKLWSDVWMPAGMKCSTVCFHCSGETCSNVMELSELINENDFDDEPTLTPSPVLPLETDRKNTATFNEKKMPTKRIEKTPINVHIQAFGSFEQTNKRRRAQCAANGGRKWP
ncbi:hypothetical protein EVAR_39715_1 [Eumeta japonica]|uniref:Uncharacterized protein n=1 Tax=Eumeta variegata TaxID=151549 RepID=A0A4C1W4S2_EUMVA|nr:hypothetical protein EVAR_39715_1 [Eumeta japonica]